MTHALNEYHESDQSLKQAIAFKYQNFLLQRKFNLLCKTQSSAFDADQEVWVPRNMKVLGKDVKIAPDQISYESIEKLVKSLDIGHINQIPNVPGVTRTVSGLVFMIIDLHLRLPHFFRKLVWFNDNTNHFVFQFSDDGAPETSQVSMSIGSLTMWNLGERVRSREFQYLLLCVSLSEKHDILELLWKQHSDEMKLLESSVFTVCGKECTMEFQPSADMSWQSWACNELNQAATYPSPYADVNKANLSTMGGSIGCENGLWKPYTNDVRESNLSAVREFGNFLPSSLNGKQIHEKLLQFMASHGIRQHGEPRIGIFAERVHPDPLHCEINAWQNILDIIYCEAVQRNLFCNFIQVLSSPVGTEDPAFSSKQMQVSTSSLGNEVAEEQSCSDLSEAHNALLDHLPNLSSPNFDLTSLGLTTHASLQMSSALEQVTPDCSVGAEKNCFGCGLPYLAKKVKEHFQDEKKRFNKLPVRLIGDQAITIARHSYRLVDSLKTSNETEGQRLRRLALSKAIEYLRNACGLFNKINTTSAEIDQLVEFCEYYFNQLSLFFPESITVTTWTVGYAIPYHAKELFHKYKVGLGIISLQAKESKHAGIKKELSLTNRSADVSASGKWWQIMRSNYVRSCIFQSTSLLHLRTIPTLKLAFLPTVLTTNSSAIVVERRNNLLFIVIYVIIVHLF